MALKLNVVTGSTRPGRVGPVFSAWFAKFALDHGRFDVDEVDLADFSLPLLDEESHPIFQQYEHDHTRRWAESVASADAYVFVTPEYDFFAPASLVNAVQIVAKEWWYKPAGVVSYGGISGGLRAAQTLRQLLGNVNVHAIPQSVPIPDFSRFVGDDNEFVPSAPIVAGATRMLDELHKWSSALKPMRAG